MTRREWLLLVLLAALWGASYLFIKVALDDLSPAMVVFTRLVLAALVLIPLAHRAGALAPLKGHWGPVALLAVVQVAGPFLLITLGEEHLASSLTGILVASVPIFTAILAVRMDAAERSRGWSLVGVMTGIVGVVVLFGVDLSGDRQALIGGLMVLLASVGYAIGALYMKRTVANVPSVGTAAATMSLSALLVAPWALATAPSEMPATDTILSMLALGAGGTGVAFLLFYRLIATVGPAKASIVAYVAPGFAVVYGALILDESLGAGTFAGLALILIGSYLGAQGRLPWSRPAAIAEPAAAPAR